MRTMDRGLAPAQYKDYMASPAWRARKEWWRDHRPRRRRCQVCGSRHYDLHHRTYVRLGRERLRDLVPLCHHHHRGLHALQDRMHWSVERASSVYLAFRRLVALAPVAGVGVGVVLLFVLLR